MKILVRLAAAAAVCAVQATTASERAVPIENGRVDVAAEDLHFECRTCAYATRLADAADAVLFISRDASPPEPPPGLTPVVYAPGALGAGWDSGYANHYFSTEESFVPTLVLRSLAAEAAPGRSPAALAAQTDGRNGIFDASRVVIKGVLGVYAAGDDFGGGGRDRFRTNSSWFLSHVGGRREGLAFVRLAAETIRALPPQVRRAANADGMLAFSLLTLFRRAQRGVESDASFMEGPAHRAALDLADVDGARLLKMAAALDEYPVPPPAFIGSELPEGNVLSPVAEDSRVLFDHSSSAQCHVSKGFAVRREVRRFRLCLRVALVDYARAEWRVLQGDSAKIHFSTAGAHGEDTVVEVERHGLFDAPRLSGAPLKTSRVDVGCFAVAASGDVSLPAVCSFEFPPEEIPPESPSVVETNRAPSVASAPSSATNAVPKGWAALVAATVEELRAEGFLPNGLLDEWRTEAGPNAAAVARYAQAKIWAMRLRVDELPESVRAEQSWKDADDARVEAFLCDFTGDGLADLVVEHPGEGGQGGCCHGFYVRLPEGGYRSIGWKIENRGVCAVPHADGRTAFVCTSEDAEGQLRTALAFWQDGRMTYMPLTCASAGPEAPPRTSFWPWKR